MEKKKLCSDAKEAIKEETNKVVENKLSQFEENIIKVVTENIEKYLLNYGDRMSEKSKIINRRKMRSSVQIILEGYIDLKKFIENIGIIKCKGKINYKRLDKVIRSNEFIYGR